MNNLIPWRRGQLQRDDSREMTPVSEMRSDWDRLFDRILDDVWSPGFRSSQAAMPLDLSETDEQIRIRAEVPGMSPDDLDISLAGDVLTLSGEKVDDDEQTASGARYYSERRFGSCQRAVKLPCPVDPNHVEAEHKNGVVTIMLQKAETVRPKRIKVRSA